MSWFDLTPQVAVMRAIGLMLIAAVHGTSQALAARWLGDPGPVRDGRASIDPFAHLSLLGSVLFVLFSAGWITPLRLDRASLRGGSIALVGIVLLSLAAVLLLGWLALLVRWPVVGALPDSAGMTADAFIGVFCDLCIWFVVLNALPLPPLTAGALVRMAAPIDQTHFDRLAKAGAAILSVAIALGWLPAVLAPLHRALARLIT